jgi:hypothetical protein
VTTVGEPGQGVTLLQFRRALPASAWLRASILWADNLAAIWPESGPMAFTSEQERSQHEIRQLRAAGLFQEKYVSGSPGTEAMTRMLEDLGITDASGQAYEAWQDDGSAVGSIPGPVSQYDPDTFVYKKKLPDWTYNNLKRRGLLQQHPSGYGYEISSPELLNRLLAAFATRLSETSDRWLVPDAEVPEQARRIAAPSGDEETRQALVLTLKGKVTPDLKTDFRRFLDFRQDEKNERARKDYIAQLTGLWDLYARGGPEHAAEQVVVRVMNDLRKARESYFYRVSNQSLAAAGLSLCGAVIPLLAQHPVQVLIGAILTAGGAAAAITVRNNAPMYIRAASRSELLAPTASI